MKKDVCDCVEKKDDTRLKKLISRYSGKKKNLLLVLTVLVAIICVSMCVYIFNNREEILLNAAYNGNTIIAQILINTGADVNAKGSYGWTPLMLAAGCGNTEVAKMLLDAGADVNIEDKNGNTALMIAEKYRHISKSTGIAELLRKAVAK